MAYGLEVNDVAGNQRIYSQSWLMTYYDEYTHSIEGIGTKKVYIVGFDPKKWGIIIEAIYFQRPDQGDKATVTLHDGYVTLIAEAEYTTTFFNFKILKGY
jgi:hypothetical protein